MYTFFFKDGNVAITCFVFCSYSKSAADTRIFFKDYFNSSAGEVSWQYNHVMRTS